MKEAPRLIRRAAAAELLRIAVFLVYYLALIALGAAILVGTLFAVLIIVLVVLPRVPAGHAFLILAFAAAGLGALALMFGFYLVKPLFSFTRNRDPRRVEIRRADCPALFALVDALVVRTGCPRPKRVFLTDEVNAGVFYDTSFWSIFLPVRKNLEIGTGLLDGTSEAELAGVLAHEFGHFGQRSMKVGSAAAVTGVVLRNLVPVDDRWDRLLNRWCESGVHAVWRFFGRATRFLANGVRRFTVHVFSFVEKGNRALSRLMEFGADDAACAVVGSDAFASALCKVQVLAWADEVFREGFLGGLCAEGMVPEDPAAARRALPALLRRSDMPVLSFDAPLPGPPASRRAPSRLRIEDPWVSHPALEDRLANVRANALPPPADAVASPSRPAAALVPRELVLRVGRRAAELAAPPSGDGGPKLRPVDSEAFEAWTRARLAAGWILPEPLDSFLRRDIGPFDLAAAKTEFPDPPCPLTEKNVERLETSRTAESDLMTLNAVATGRGDFGTVFVDGAPVRRKQLPVEAFRIRAEELREKAGAIDRSLYAWLRAPLAGPDAAALDADYASLFNAQRALSETIPSLLVRRDAIIGSLAGRKSLPRKLFLKVIDELVSFERDLRAAISVFEGETLPASDPFAEFAGAADVFAWADAPSHVSVTDIDGNVVTRMFAVLDTFHVLVFNRRGRARASIARACRLRTGPA